MSAYKSYLIDWQANHQDVVEPEHPRNCPDMTGSKPIYGYRVWGSQSKTFELADGRILEIGVTSIWSECYAVFPNHDAWNRYAKPLSATEFWG